jgi:hypothetical protein
MGTLWIMEDFTDEQDPTGHYRAAMAISEILGSSPCRDLVSLREMAIDERDRAILKWALETLLAQAAFIAELRHQVGGEIPPDLEESIRTMARQIVEKIEAIRNCCRQQHHELS